MKLTITVAALAFVSLLTLGCTKPQEKKPTANNTAPNSATPSEKPADAKPADVKPADNRTEDSPAPTESKPADASANEAKPVEPAPVEPAPTETKPDNTTSSDPALPEPKPADSAPAANDTPPKTSGKLILGADELFVGIGGGEAPTIEEIKTYLAEPKNHEVLQYELPLGLSAGAGQEKGLKENPLTRAKIELGRQLYFDTRLSKDGTISCASCHAPETGFTANTQFGVGVGGLTGNRNSPTSYNRILSDLQFWDGRAPSLEEQAKGPIANPIEMTSSHDACVACVKGLEGYRLQFEKVFAQGDQPGEVTIDTVAQAIAAFERAIVTGPSPFDFQEEFDRLSKLEPEDLEDNPVLKARFEQAQKNVAEHPMSESAKRGQVIYFSNKGNCSACHVGPNLTDEKYHNIGVGMDAEMPDLGRFTVTMDPKDWGAFKTPTIRNVEHTAPYMHDGSMKTLEEVVEFYNKGGLPNKNLSDKIKKLDLTEQEKKDLVEFMKACSGPFPKMATGKLPQA